MIRSSAKRNDTADAMPEKSSRRVALEQSLAEDPTDSFLRYGLAMQCLREGDVEEGHERLLALIADHPDDQIAAYQQLGQSFAELGEPARAIDPLGNEETAVLILHLRVQQTCYRVHRSVVCQGARACNALWLHPTVPCVHSLSSVLPLNHAIEPAGRLSPDFGAQDDLKCPVSVTEQHGNVGAAGIGHGDVELAITVDVAERDPIGIGAGAVRGHRAKRDRTLCERAGGEATVFVARMSEIGPGDGRPNRGQQPDVKPTRPPREWVTRCRRAFLGADLTSVRAFDIGLTPSVRAAKKAPRRVRPRRMHPSEARSSGMASANGYSVWRSGSTAKME